MGGDAEVPRRVRVRAVRNERSGHSPAVEPKRKSRSEEGALSDLYTVVPGTVAGGPVAGALLVERRTADSAVTSITIEPTEPVFAGHYPGFPIFPGVCVVECVHRGALASAPVPGLALVAVESARFLGPVLPGDRLDAELGWSGGEDRFRCAAAVRTQRGPAAQVRLRYEPRGDARHDDTGGDAGHDDTGREH